MFDKAISDLAHCWENVEFNGYPVRIKAIICREDNLKWRDYSTVKDFFKASLRDLHQYKDLKNECKSNVPPLGSSFKRSDVHTLQRPSLLR